MTRIDTSSQVPRAPAAVVRTQPHPTASILGNLNSTLLAFSLFSFIQFLHLQGLLHSVAWLEEWEATKGSLEAAIKCLAETSKLLEVEKASYQAITRPSPHEKLRGRGMPRSFGLVVQYQGGESKDGRGKCDHVRGMAVRDTMGPLCSPSLMRQGFRSRAVDSPLSTGLPPLELHNRRNHHPSTPNQKEIVIAAAHQRKRDRICVTGEIGFLALRLIIKLLQQGYAVNSTVRSYPGGNPKDMSFLTNLEGTPERLRIFIADLSNPKSCFKR
nr:vestitone reductase-like [Ipomoea batatas]